MMKKKIVWIAVVLLILSCWSCKKVPFYAGDGSVLVMSANKTYLRTGGDTAVITVLGFSADGQALHDHTLVLFSSDMGTLDSSEKEMLGGRIEVQFYSGDSSGIAHIRARSGSITADPDPLEIMIGSAALANLSISANPTAFGSGGGRSLIRVFAFDAMGNLLTAIPIILTASAGFFEIGDGIYVTGTDGMIEDYLQTTQSSTVSAESGTGTGDGGKISVSVEITVEQQTENRLPTAAFSYSPQSPLKEEKIYFNGSLSSDSDGVIKRWVWDFGDGTFTGGEKVNHSYSWLGPETKKTFTVVLKVTDDRGGVGTTSLSIAVGI